MSGVGTKRIHFSEEFRTSIIAVDEYDSVNFCGKLYNPFLKQSVEVKSFQHLIKEIDTLMDEIGCPMSGMRGRPIYLKRHRFQEERLRHLPSGFSIGITQAGREPSSGLKERPKSALEAC